MSSEDGYTEVIERRTQSESTEGGSWYQRAQRVQENIHPNHHNYQSELGKTKLGPTSPNQVCLLLAASIAYVNVLCCRYVIR